ncbi:MAG: prenyltransferase/squalene oxidase repeat-containing protein [Opitutales bacterium]
MDDQGELDQPQYPKGDEPLPEEAYDDLPFEPASAPAQETSMGRYMREHRLLNSMLMSLFIMLILFWALWDLILFAAIGSPDGTDFADAGFSPPSQKQKKKQQVKLQKRQKKASPSVRNTFKTKAISEIAMPELNDLDVVDIDPVVSTAAPSIGDVGSTSGATNALQGLGLALPKPMQARCDPRARMGRLVAGGGHRNTETAIKAGLDWLKAKQAKDGSWSADGGKYKKSMTAMGLLCYLGHCELQDSPEYGKTVHKAIEFLTSTPPIPTSRGRPMEYSHPIRTYALCEAYTMTKIKKLETYAKKAAEFVVKGQHKSGGWAYGYGKGPTAHVDLSITGWNIQALKAGALTGLYIQGLDEAMDKAVEYTKRCQDKSGQFSYTAGGRGEPSLTGTGVLCLQIWKNAKSKEAEGGLEWIVNHMAKDWAHVNVYEWYYHAQACFQAQGSAGAKYWRLWNGEFQKIVLPAQASDGHWPEAAHFHGDSDVYRTTMAILMLEVYYRYAPMGGGKTH